MIGLSIEDRDYYQMIKDGQEKVISDLVESYVDGALVVPVARGVKINGQLAGMVVYSISVDRLAASISDIKLNKGDILSLVDRSGRIVFLIPMWKKKKSIVIPI